MKTLGKHNPYIGKEVNFQIAAMDLLRLKHPKMLAIHVANERKTTAWQGARLKRKGVLAGVSDILLLKYKIAIELKVKGGKLSPKQKEFISNSERDGWECFVCYNMDSFEKIIEYVLRKFERAR